MSIAFNPATGRFDISGTGAPPASVGVGLFQTVTGIADFRLRSCNGFPMGLPRFTFSEAPVILNALGAGQDFEAFPTGTVISGSNPNIAGGMDFEAADLGFTYAVVPIEQGGSDFEKYTEGTTTSGLGSADFKGRLAVDGGPAQDLSYQFTRAGQSFEELVAGDASTQLPAGVLLPVRQPNT